MVGVWIARITSSCSCILQRPSNRTPGWSCRLHRYAQILKNLWRWDAKMRAAPSTFQIFSKHIHTTRLTTSGHKRLELAFPSCFQRTFLDFSGVSSPIPYQSHHPSSQILSDAGHLGPAQSKACDVDLSDMGRGLSFCKGSLQRRRCFIMFLHSNNSTCFLWGGYRLESSILVLQHSFSKMSGSATLKLNQKQLSWWRQHQLGFVRKSPSLYPFRILKVSAPFNCKVQVHPVRNQRTPTTLK